MKRSIRDLVRTETWEAQAAVHKRAVWSYEATLDEEQRLVRDLSGPDLWGPIDMSADDAAWKSFWDEQENHFAAALGKFCHDFATVVGSPNSLNVIEPYRTPSDPEPKT